MYMGLNSLGLSAIPSALSPVSALFQNGEPGAVFIATKPTADWTTNPDLITMYQDSAGTTPVTALEQTVGLHLDTRPMKVGSLSNTVGQPLRGPQQWDNSKAAFAGSASQISSGVYRILSTDGSISSVQQVGGIAMVSGAWYEAAFNVDSVTTAGSGLTVDSGLGGGVAIAATTGAKRCIFQAVSAAQLSIKRAGGITDIQISGLSFRLVYGNHRSQASAGARGVLSARYNKVTARNANPVDLTGVTLINATNGLTTLTVVNDASALAAAGLSGICTLGNVYKLDNTAGDTIASAVFAGATGNANNHQFMAWVRGGTGLIGGVGGTKTGIGPSAGYVKASTVLSVVGSTVNMCIQANVGQVVYGILPDLREACYSYLPTPQVILGTGSSNTDYDDTGFPARIKYSGAQGYSTGTVDFSGSDKAQVWWGGSQLTDSSIGIVVELGDNTVDLGTFYLAAPITATGTGNAWAAYRGSGTPTGAGFSTSAAPLALVLNASYDIAAPSIVTRKNGAQTGANATSVGTGTFNSKLLNFGSRNASATATYPLTGDEFISIVRGGSTPATGTIYSVEQYCGKLMGLNV